MKVSIIVPAHNEGQRIGTMLKRYCNYFDNKCSDGTFDYELVVVLNACSDNTEDVVRAQQKESSRIRVCTLLLGGKGRAVYHGFVDALTRDNDLIGFVDADMATLPEAFDELINSIDGRDGIIASRYMKESRISPARPLLKRWGSKLIYEPLVWFLFGLRFKDLQCGAKLFSKKVIETIVPHVAEVGWAFDVELLYLCRRHRFNIYERPTIWHDKAGSKLRVVHGGIRMMGSLFAIRFRHLY